MSPEATALRLSQRVQQLGEDGRNIKERIAIAARRLGLTWRQAKAIVYRERGVEAHVAERIEAAWLDHLAAKIRKAQHELAMALAENSNTRLEELAAQARDLARAIEDARRQR